MIITASGQRLPTVTGRGVFGFFDDYRFLSNFHVLKTPIYYDGLLHPSTEHAYMAAKTDDVDLKASIACAPTPLAARKMGRLVPLKPDWEDVKVEVMRDVLVLKFSDEDLRFLLDATAGLYLEETNNWGDRFWGVDGGRGENMLGKLLMSIRDGTEPAFRNNSSLLKF